jgi:hypothetical protein
MNQFEPITVECYAGYKANETPRAFIYQGRRYDILEVVDRWCEGGIKPGTPRLDYYKVKADDDRQYIIRYNHLFDKWALVIRVEE